MALDFPHDVTWAILAAPPPSTPLAFPQSVEWAILASDPVPDALEFPQVVTWRIFGDDVFEVEIPNVPIGVVGQITVEMETEAGVNVYPATTSQIIERPPGSGVYVATIPFLGVGVFFVLWKYAGITVRQMVVVTERTVMYAAVPPGRIAADYLTAV
jgi:hypothetical protein